MMDIQAYIESGILNDYCLGLLTKDQELQVEENMTRFPVIKSNIDAINLSLENYAFSYQEKPSVNLKDRIWQTIDNITIEEKETLLTLPILNRFSDKEHWKKIIEPILKHKNLSEEMFIRVLRDDETVLQTLIWTRVNYPDEVHDDLQESFMILEGECECFIGDSVIKMIPGDFLEIPLHTHHDVKLVSSHVLAIIQRRKVA